ncbi:MAG: hypothetical protein BROFUL_02051 [Candidatus Brocadia fulgida]|jgi:hypothetical protein|uniref:Uncharacterized protein n=1 Tax=Candidatus Brocadia fulgida TaxID=380242 RepID=A0A0M2UWA7_9BACT|nr:MAG: hypothetical protein BROFUL_02051 [Candidatus Brocadia fulgida]MBV6517979.1 hypothetical protein [Candidatus Brocadia fulgida]
MFIFSAYSVAICLFFGYKVTKIATAVHDLEIAKKGGK